ncbi:MAG: methyltransferase domain-containing protein [Rhizobiaceae bacterium]|jgi:S-adenosylmethionine-diacylgycerolhomoserine-N-methlytransferase|nr:methyltransferase domain-containing protein [Rhizobiaceae bacterium]
MAHAKLMDGVYARQRHIYDLTRKYYLLGRDRAISELTPPSGGHVLEIGCGTGRNLIIAARQYPDVTFHGLDISSEMLSTARSSIAKVGLSERIRLACADAARFDAGELFGRQTFDAVLMSYTLSMIPPWDQALQKGISVLSDNGKLVFVDFWDQSGLPGWSRLVLRKWLDLFHVAPREGLGEVAHDFAMQHGRNCLFDPLYRGYACLGTIR